MSDRAGLHCSCNEDAVYHKGFYNDENFIKSLAEICYDDFLNRQMMTNFHTIMQMFYFVVLVIFLLNHCKRSWDIICI